MAIPPSNLTKRELAIWKALADYLKDPISFESTVSSLAVPIETDYINGGMSSTGYKEGYVLEDPDDTPDVCQLYSVILRYAKTLSWNDAASHSTLIKLVQAFSKRPSPPIPPGAPEIGLWQGFFGNEVRDLWNIRPGDEVPGLPKKSIEEDSQEWTNFNAFLAYFTVQMDRSFWLYGITSLRVLLETKDSTGTFNHDRSDMDVWLAAAAVWMIIAGDEMYKGVKEQEQNPAKDETWATLKRWSDWKAAFQVIGEDKERKWKEATRKMAAEAAEKMQLSEGQ